MRSTSARAKLRGEHAYLEIRKMVLRGELPLGQRLAEEQIAELLGVSRTPVRDAFARLHGDRLLTRYADGGFFVVEPDLIDLRDLYELRLVLELRGLTRATEHGYDHDLSVLEPLRDRWRAIQLAPPAPDGSFIDLDESFHVGLSRAAGNMVITETLETVNARIRPVRMHDFLSEDRITVSISEHLGILEAVLMKDLVLAVDRLRTHIGISMDVVEKRAAHALTQMILNRRTRR
ncbi:MAG TPA: GntR family transcriptional regulator [Microbacteriaceae bacterium]|jgi:DNA-binding GntR family transcriptional regulator|nr:GntR family transcriptional regulator [Microbacteriaceae bacterium]